MATNKKLEARRNKVLRYDYWTCKLCDDIIDTMSKVSTDEHKTELLVGHIKTEHKGSRDVDQLLEDKYLVLYFEPRVEIIQDNVKNDAEVKKVEDTLS